MALYRIFINVTRKNIVCDRNKMLKTLIAFGRFQYDLRIEEIIKSHPA